MLGRLKSLRRRHTAPQETPQPAHDPWAWDKRALATPVDEIADFFTEELRELRPDLLPVELELDPEMPGFDLRLRREGSKLWLHSGARPDNQVMLNFLKGRGTTPAWWLLNTPGETVQLSISLSDGDQPSVSDFSFCACDPAIGLLPDNCFFRRRGYERLQTYVSNHAPDWDQRDGQVIWRGDPNGQGLFSLCADMADNPGVKQRLRLALKAQELPGIDVGFVPRTDKNCAALARAGLMADRIPPISWMGRKFAVDIDGFSNAWSNLMERFHMGCCVLKVDSPFGFRQWYYDRLVPFETHVPVRADLSDLGEKLDWIRANDAQCREIAQNGRALAQALDFDSVSRWAGDAIAAR